MTVLLEYLLQQDKRGRDYTSYDYRYGSVVIYSTGECTMMVAGRHKSMLERIIQG